MFKKIDEIVEKHRKMILDAERYIWQNPETGYKEVKTSAYMKENFKKLGYELNCPEGITGFTATLDTGRPGPCVLVLGELDSVICTAHKEADPITGAVHSCGHNTQCAALLGVAAALKEKDITDKMCGKIILCAVPAEELIEIEYRTELKKQGKIKYYGGKSEFLYRGLFDEADMAFMVHASVAGYMVRRGFVGCIAKKINYKGKASHAGGSPWDGCNALYAATCGLNAVNAIRETFKESDIIRVHPIITKAGDVVNAIPENAYIESFVRGSNFEAMIDANKKMNRALCGAALSLGANVDIMDMPGYSPLINDDNLIEVCQDAAKIVMPDYEFIYDNTVSSGSSDIGDLSCVMPVVHPYTGGAKGTAHGSDYQIVDPVAACVTSAKFQLEMLYLLLKDNGERAKKVIAEYTPVFKSKDEYFAYIDAFNCEGERITYKGNSAEVTL